MRLTCYAVGEHGEQKERPMPVEQGDRYLAYMLRLWQVESDEGRIWRASLEDARTGERHGFASLEALVCWLRRVTGSASDGAAPPGAGKAEAG